MPDKMWRKCDDNSFQPNVENQYRYFTLPIEQIPEYKSEEIQVLHHGLGSEGAAKKAGLFWKCVLPPMCTDKDGEEALKAQYICENAKNDSNINGKREGSSDIQILVNKEGCAYWFPLEEKIIMYDLKLDAEGKALKWKEKKIYVIEATEAPEDKTIDVTDCATEQPAP
ncbi:hypothetical protein EBU24_03190 [bacterium]|nr:hypothetical protein [bacterium]